jgi:D-alanyl-D-alanine carboxypeptidase/D-alanyl-D-alanine-endopeptidase (penicillin-binding protein 4)
MKIRIIILFSCIVSWQVLWCQNVIEKSITDFKALPELTNAIISFQAIDMSSGEQIATLNPSLSIPTASTAKLFATASALEILGAEFRPKTRIYIDGTIDKNGMLNGNIWIRGGGDVTLGSKYFTEDGHQRDFLISWVDSLQKLGIKSVSGAIIADGSEFGYSGAPDGWSWSDMGNYYGAGPAGICVFDNLLKMHFKTGASQGSKTELVTTFPIVPNLTFHNYITSENVTGDNSYIFGAPYSLDRFATGSLPLNHAGFEVKGSLPDSEFQLAHELFQQLTNSGIIVGEGAKSVRQENLDIKNRYHSNFQLLITHEGEKIIDIARLTNMKSVNLFAEGLVCLIGFQKTGFGSTEEGLKQVEKYWSAKMNLTGLFLKDGSGLSRSNGISADHFCALLTAMNVSKNAALFKATLPVAGKSGTLSNLCKNQLGEGRIIAKSGSMSRIKSFAGYIDSKSGKKIAFSITVNNYSCSSSVLTVQIEKLLNALAIYE